jgi:ectoine hydroxylase-related dioxygenase (phytanoyl-CoA dioxygenase family)
MSTTVEHPIKNAALTEAERQQFERDGFLLKKGLLSKDQVAQISTEIDALHERMAQNTPNGVGVAWEHLQDGKPRKIRQLMNSEVVSPTLNSSLRSDTVLDIVESLIGPEIALFHSKLLMKAAQDGTVTPWHQDFAYWKKDNNGPVQVNCMLAIDPATKENGCIQFAPGTQKLGLLTHEQRKNMSFGVFLPGYFNERPEAVLVEMEPGDCVFFGSLVIHGSDGNKSAKHRRANTVAYTVPGADPSHVREVLRTVA